jgi:hypothetical protein
MFIYNYFYNNVEKKKFYGWKKPVINDDKFSYYIHEELYFLDNIKHVDLRDKCPPIYD